MIVANSVYINKETKVLIQMIDSLPDPDSQDFHRHLSSVKDAWKKLKNVARFSFPYAELTKIEISLVELEARAGADDISDYIYAKESLVFLLNELCRLEKLS